MASITGEQKLLTLIAHLSYLLCGLGFIIAPLIIFILKKDDPFVYDHARQALIAHLALLAVSIGVGILNIFVIGILLLPILALLWLTLIVTSFIAGFKAVDGEYYRYPFIQPLVEKLQ
ncbi:MAG: Chloroplast import component protein [Firmicutes bacterium]|nr:Chloroplast import component protein [Bacillota bacterium]